MMDILWEWYMAFKMALTGWRDIDSAPKDGTMLLLICIENEDPEIDSNATEDCLTWHTIGFSQDDINNTDDGWFTAGWDWCHDEFTAGHGEPIFWKLYPIPVKPRTVIRRT